MGSTQKVLADWTLLRLWTLRLTLALVSCVVLHSQTVHQPPLRWLGHALVSCAVSQAVRQAPLHHALRLCHVQCYTYRQCTRHHCGGCMSCAVHQAPLRHALSLCHVQCYTYIQCPRHHCCWYAMPLASVMCSVPGSAPATTAVVASCPCVICSFPGSAPDTTVAFVSCP